MVNTAESPIKLACVCNIHVVGFSMKNDYFQIKYVILIFLLKTKIDIVGK